MQPNKAIVGRNAFAHESGIHQDGVLKERTTYEIMDATTVGLESNELVLGKHSGRHALRQALEDLGFTIDGQALNQAFKRFKEIADKKKQVTAMDLEALVTDELREAVGTYSLEWFDVEASTRRPPHATVAVRNPEGAELQGSFTGDGPVDAIFRAINVATGVDAQLREFRVDAVTGGQDALGEVSVSSSSTASRASGQGVATDILEARASPTCARSASAVRNAAQIAAARPTRSRRARADALTLVDDLAAAVRVPSLTGDEKPVLELLAERGEALGLRRRAARVRPRGRCAHPDWPGAEAPRDELSGLDADARRPRRRGSRSAATSTSSTSGTEPWARDPFSGDVADGRVHGRGSVDMKARRHRGDARPGRGGRAGARGRPALRRLRGGRRAGLLRRARARQRVRRRA